MTALTNKFNAISAPAGRVLLSLIFIMAGLQKISGYSGTQAYMEAMGVSGGLLPLVILVELGGGIALLLGWKARTAAFVLGGFSVISGVLFHLVPGMSMEGMAAQAEYTNFLKNLTIAGGMGMVVTFGAGHWSLDNRQLTSGRATAA